MLAQCRTAATPLVVSIAIVASLCVPAMAAPSRPALRVDVTGRPLQPGDLVVVTITTDRETDRVVVRALDRDVVAFRVAPRRWRALVGIDLDQQPGTSTVTVESRSGGVAVVTRRLVIRAGRFPTRRLTVDPEFVNPSPDIRERIGRESAYLANVYSHSADEPLWHASFVRPVTAAVSSRFGTHSILNGEPRNAHAGVDFASRAGAPIKAPNGGRVVVARPLFLSGNTVVIDHGVGLFSLLAHLSRIDVHEGELIRAGQVVGRVGATGRATGAHLHWSVRAGGARVDPMAALAVLRP